MSYTYGSEYNCTLHNGTTNSKYKCRLGYQVNSQSIANNTSNITLRLQVKSTDSGYNTYGYKQTSKIDGTSLSAKSFDMRDTGTWKTFGERTITVSHNSSGSYSSSKSGSFTTTATSTYSLKSGSASVTVKPKNIPRYVNITSFYTQSTSLNSAVIYWATDNARSATYYSLDGGSNWIGSATYGESVASNSKSGTFNVKGLNPNTTYNIKIKIQRTDSGLWTESNTISFTTKDIARLTSYPNFNLGDPVTVEYKNPSGAPIQVGLYLDGSTPLAAYRNCSGTSYTFNFTDEELDRIYKIMSGNSLQAYFYINTNNNEYRENKLITINLTGNQKTARVKVEDSWKRR